MVLYVDYSYYKESFHGKIVSAESFNQYAAKSGAYIRYLTMNRVNDKNICDDIKDAVCAACDIFYAGEQGSKELKSENNDGYSVSYVTEQLDGQTLEELLRKKAYEAVYPYLIYTGLLNRRIC